MKVLNSPSALREWRKAGSSDLDIGFVPTMGALHEGHEALIRRSSSENQSTLVSIFVNPTQFNQASDFEKYPKTLDGDLEICRKAGASAVFVPVDPASLYPDEYRYRLTESDWSRKLCGEFRPGHFDGVLTVVLKLLNLARAKRAYFGEKDHQQLTLIMGMARAFFLETEIIPVPTVREESGLALSSRNRRLSPSELSLAPLLYQTLKTSPSAPTAREILEDSGFKVEYIEDHVHHGRTRRYAAAWLGETRLIDNVEL